MRENQLIWAQLIETFPFLKRNGGEVDGRRVQKGKWKIVGGTLRRGRKKTTVGILNKYILKRTEQINLSPS